MSSIWQDLRYAVRQLVKSPGFTAVAVLTLALGIGANTAIFSVVNAVLLRPLPFKDSSRLVMIWEGFPKLNHPKMNFSPPDFVSLVRSQKPFEGIGGFRNVPFDISGQGQPEQVWGAHVSASLFSVLGVEPTIGRNFTPEEDAPGHNVVLLSYGLWHTRYGANPNLVGRTIELDRQPYTVVGVMPKGLTFPLPGPEGSSIPAVLWTPMAFDSSELQSWGRLYATGVIARLKPGVTLEQARAEVGSLADSILASYSADAAKRFQGVQLKLSVNPFHDEVTGSVHTLLWMLMAAVAMVLLIACANVATLLVSRGSSRQKEMAVRTALGAMRFRLVRQMLTESLLLAAIGGILGFLFAITGKNLLLSLVPQSIPMSREVSIGGEIAVFVIVISCLTAVLFGLAPAYQISRVSLEGSLREGGRGGTPGRARHRLQESLVIVEFALALVLVVASGLLIRSFTKLLAIDPGFHVDHVLTLKIPLPLHAYPKAAQIRQFYQQVLDQTTDLPGVKALGLANDIPLEIRNMVRIDIQDRNETGSPSPGLPETWTLGDYFRVTGIPLIKGRFFTPEDRLGSQPVAIVSQSMANEFWPGKDAIGKQIRWGQPDAPWQTIVGIVGDVNDPPDGQPGKSHVYTPYQQLSDHWVEDNVYGTWRSLNLAVRTQTDPNSLTSAVVRQIHSLDPDLAVTDIQSMTQVMEASVAGPKFNTLLLGFFGALALLLASIGIYGVLAYMVAQQTHEIGIRMALGATRGDVLSLVLWRGLRLAGVGTVIGVALALALTQLMTGLLYGVKATDPLTFGGVASVLLVVALLACFIPARRAAKVDPMVALHYE